MSVDLWTVEGWSPVAIIAFLMSGLVSVSMPSMVVSGKKFMSSEKISMPIV